MKPERIKKCLDRLLAGDSEELGRLARHLGHEFPKNCLEILAEFRSILASSIPAEGRYIRNSIREDGYIRGYLAALLDVAASFSAEIESEIIEEEDVLFLRENALGKLLVILLDGPLPAEFLAGDESTIALVKQMYWKV